MKFLSRGSGYTLFLTSTEAILSLSRPEETDKSLATDRGDQKKEGERAHRDVLRMRLVGARSTPRVEGADELSVRSNYFIGNDPKEWRTVLSLYDLAEEFEGGFVSLNSLVRMLRHAKIMPKNVPFFQFETLPSLQGLPLAKAYQD